MANPTKNNVTLCWSLNGAERFIVLHENFTREIMALAQALVRVGDDKETGYEITNVVVKFDDRSKIEVWPGWNTVFEYVVREDGSKARACRDTLVSENLERGRTKK